VKVSRYTESVGQPLQALVGMTREEIKSQRCGTRQNLTVPGKVQLSEEILSN
jgi:hypothetical protein